MAPKITKTPPEHSPQDHNSTAQGASTNTLLEHLVNCTKQHNNTLALLAELLAQQTKQSTLTDRYTPQGIPTPKASGIPWFVGPLSDADSALTHLHWLQQVLHTHSLLTPSADA